MNNTFARPEHVLIRNIGDEALLLNTENEKYYSLNVVGSSLYALLVEGKSLSAALESLATTFEDVPPKQIEMDCTALVTDLQKNGLLNLN